MTQLLHATRSRRVWIVSSVVLAVGIALVLALARSPDTAEAKSSYQSALINVYPVLNNSKLDSCQTCHTNVPDLNPFGQAYQNNGHNFPALELLDSDSDGWSNIQEIQSITFPGDSSDFPSSNTPPTFTPTPTNTPLPGGPPPADPPASQEGEFKLIGWNDLGMHCLDDSFEVFSILPPYNTLWAQLVRQPTDGGMPEVVTEGVTIEYSFVDNTYSVGKIDFWDYVGGLFGVSPPPDIGLTGVGLTGQMQAEEDHFVVEGVPLTPLNDSDLVNPEPYQLARLVAKDSTTGDILAETTFVAPVSTEMHCDNCHGDGQQEDIATGDVRVNILALHDKEEETNLVDSQPVLCANCHASPALGTAGMPGVPNLSRAMHSKHASDIEGGGEAGGDVVPPGGATGLGDDVALVSQVIGWMRGESPTVSDAGLPGLAPVDDGTQDCYQCHPGAETSCLRGVMAEAGMWCTDCHGSMQDVASEDRTPWVDEPKCGDCHGEDHAENPDTLFRNSTGHGGLYCSACHGSTHAILPSMEPRDNMQVIALQGYADTLRECTVCHGDNIPDGPGPHGMANPGNSTQAAVALAPSGTTVYLSDGDFVVDVALADAGTVGGFEFTLGFDPAVVQVEEAALGSFLGSTGLSTGLLGPDVDNTGGTVHFGGYAFDGSAFPAGSGVLAQITLRPVAAGTSTLAFNSLILSGPSGTALERTVAPGSVTVIDGLSGDLNGDCTVDILDVMAEVALWDTQSGDAAYDPARDFNGDGRINLMDIMWVAARWGSRCTDPNTPDRAASAPSAPSRVRVQPVSPVVELANGDFAVALIGEDVVDLAGFELELRYDPAVLSLADVAVGDFLTGAGRTLIPLGPTTADGTIHLGGLSVGSGAGASGTGTLATLTFTPLSLGTSSLIQVDTVLADTSGRAIPTETVDSAVTITPHLGQRVYLPNAQK